MGPWRQHVESRAYFSTPVPSAEKLQKLDVVQKTQAHKLDIVQKAHPKQISLGTMGTHHPRAAT